MKKNPHNFFSLDVPLVTLYSVLLVAVAILVILGIGVINGFACLAPVGDYGACVVSSPSS